MIKTPGHSALVFFEGCIKRPDPLRWGMGLCAQLHSEPRGNVGPAARRLAVLPEEHEDDERRDEDCQAHDERPSHHAESTLLAPLVRLKGFVGSASRSFRPWTRTLALGSLRRTSTDITRKGQAAVVSEALFSKR